MSAGNVVLVRPAAFGFNTETAGDNVFQRKAQVAPDAVLREFDSLATALVERGIAVTVFRDTATPAKPDAVFPNNWFSTHSDGRVILYPMRAPNRRLERDSGLLDALRSEFTIESVLDLTHHEKKDCFLEGTGSLVLDAKTAFACASPRTDLALAGDVCKILSRKLMSFRAEHPVGSPVYHTNVLLAVAPSWAIVCADCILESDRPRVLEALDQGDRAVIHISREQMEAFAGNALGLANNLLVISQTGWDSLSTLQRKILESLANIYPAEIPTIERIGGGSVRCMIAENFLRVK